MTPAIAHYVWLVWLFWLLMIPIATFILYHTTGYLTGEYPSSFRKAILIVLAMAAAVYFTFDVSSYAFVLLMQDPNVGIHLPPHYSYFQWFTESFAMKWQVLGFVPIIRYIPIMFALTVGGTLQVFLLTVPFRFGVAVFLAQLFLTVVAMVLLSIVFTFGIQVYEFAAQGGGRGHHAAAGPDSLEHLAERVRNLGGNHDAFWHQAHASWVTVRGYLDPVLRPVAGFMRPVTRHLPHPVEDFLEEGGWLILVPGLIAATIALLRHHRRRPQHHHHHRKHGHASARPRDRLSLIGDAFTELGPHQITVNGQGARLRLVVLAPAAPTSPELRPEMIRDILESVRPGLKEIVLSDNPRIEVWRDHRAVDSFRQTFYEGVEVPEAKGEPSPWILLAGDIPGDAGKVHLGLALHTDQPSQQRTLDVEAELWSKVLGLREVSENERF